MNLRPWKFCFAYQLSFSINVKNFNLSNMPPEKNSSTNSWQDGLMAIGCLAWSLLFGTFYGSRNMVF
ncbi:hypothetical protein QQP08_025860 [Theobroma cacao]|nr:hypothetical protein QQP08_025860 [Theobroma cacao]